MNQEHLKFICAELQLGSPVDVATSVYGCRGGSFMWRLNTKTGNYAIKQLAPIVNITSEKMTAKYELSEKIAYQFIQQGIPAVSAIMKSGKHLIIVENTGYLIYPWVEAYTLGRNEISETHALKIAEIIAKLHSINMSVPEIKEPHVDIHTRDRIIAAIDKAVSFKHPFARSLKDNQNLILSLNEDYIAIVPLLLEDTVVTHGDLDHMLHAYIKSGGTLKTNHMKSAFYSSIGSMVNWMLYNIELACTSDVPKEKEIAAEEINSVITGMMTFKMTATDLLKISL